MISPAKREPEEPLVEYSYSRNCQKVGGKPDARASGQTLCLRKPTKTLTNTNIRQINRIAIGTIKTSFRVFY